MLSQFVTKWVIKYLAICVQDWLIDWHLDYTVSKGQLNSEWIYDVIVSPKMPTKNFKDFCPGSFFRGGRAEIFKILVGILGETMTS